MDLPLLRLLSPGPAYTELGWTDSLVIMVVGFVLVVTVLSALAGATALVGRFFGRIGSNVVRDRSVTQLKVQADEGAVDEQAIAAAISAALHVYLEGRSHRILSISRNAPGWAHEGRRQIFSSHRIR